MLRDLLGEALRAVLARPARMALTTLGTLLGIGTLVSTIGLITTAGAQIISHFDELAATEVVVAPAPTFSGAAESTLPFDAEDRIGRLNGVAAAGTLSNTGELTVRSTTVYDPQAPADPTASVMAASPGLIDAVRGTVDNGRWFDSGHSNRADRVAVLGADLAERLHLTDVLRQPAVFLDNQPYSVIGILSAAEREPRLLEAVVIPDGTAVVDYDLAAPTSLRIETDVGAARLVASQAALALIPQDPQSVRVTLAAEPDVVRAEVAEDVQALLVVLGLVSLLIGAIGIANTTLVSVLERTGEIGLRRSLGATRAQVAGQFLVESACMGGLGGILGASLGVLVTLGVSYARTWTAVMPIWLPAAAAALGALVGLLAGAYPAWRATRVEPIVALRTAG